MALRHDLRRHAAYAAAILLVGLAGAGFAIAFRLALHHGLKLLTGDERVLDGFRALPRLGRLCLPAVGGLCAGLVGLVTARSTGGHGVGAILETVALGRGRLSLRVTLWKSLASFLALVTGGSLGREGSIVQFGASAGAAAGAHLGVDPKRTRALVAAGTAAGFAAAYNTPLAAVLFVVEIVTGLATFEVVLPVVVATMVSTAATRAAVGGGPIYGARTFALASNAEFVAYLALGALAGVVGPAFLASLGAGERAFRASRLPGPARGALGGLGVGLLACALPEVTGNGYEAIQLILDGRVPVALFGVLLVAKALATVSSVSSGSPGGIFTPTLFLGAALGGLVGTGVQALPAVFGHGTATGSYALVGMAALTAATTHAPLMAAVLVFELSGDYAIVLPLLLSTVTATLVARALRRDSVYTEDLRRRGVDPELLQRAPAE
jgi:CIC family chloride channel protein